jgi:hypothetical protein
MTRYGIILHPSSFSLCPSCEFLLCSKDINRGVHGDKRFVFAHVFLQEVTEGTEKLCQIAFLLFKNIVANISVHSVDPSEAGGLILQSRCMNGYIRVSRRIICAKKQYHERK